MLPAADDLDAPAKPALSYHCLNLRSLSLRHFRNYAEARIELTGGPVVLTGRNGAGKTNILEAISLLTPGRGLRRARLSEIDSHYTPGCSWSVTATVDGMRGETKIGTGRDGEAGPEQADKRVVRIDEKPARSQAELGRHLAMIWLTPQMEQLFNESSSSARKFLDRLVYSFDTEHASRVNEYEFAMRERNRILQAGQHEPAWLDSLERAMAESASAIASARLQATANINHAITQSDLSFPKASMHIRGLAEDWLEEGFSAIEVEEKLRENWAGNRRIDGAAGRTLSGIHRSEMQVFHTEKQARAETCSTGEQKAMLLSIVLAQARAGALWRGVIPVILLDEVITHLDGTRRLELFEEICQIGAQIWMTGTDRNLFTGLDEKTQFLQVENGTLKTY